MDVEGFVELVKQAHPEIAEEIERLDAAPNSALTAGALRRLTQRAIDSGDREVVDRCFETARAAWDAGDDRVQNSLGLSWMRDLNFDDQKHQRSWAWPLLHPRLKDLAGSLGVKQLDP